MTTDNRTNEPTDYSALIDELREDALDAGHIYEEQLLTKAADAITALVAAQGAAPQAESEDEFVCRCGHGTGSHDFSDPREPCKEALCDCRKWFGVAPVLPSSTVDEDALATVVRKSENAWQKATGPTTRHEWIARAVAEWLKGAQQ